MARQTAVHAQSTIHAALAVFIAAGGCGPERPTVVPAINPNPPSFDNRPQTPPKEVETAFPEATATAASSDAGAAAVEGSDNSKTSSAAPALDSAEGNDLHIAKKKAAKKAVSK